LHHTPATVNKDHIEFTSHPQSAWTGHWGKHETASILGLIPGQV